MSMLTLSLVTALHGVKTERMQEGQSTIIIYLLINILFIIFNNISLF